MKKFICVTVLSVLAAGIVTAQQLQLKEVIINSARGIEAEVPQRSKVAILNVTSPTRSFSDYVIDELISELLTGKKVTVVDRQNLTAVLDEMKFQYSGYVSDESMVSIGKMIGAQYIISGALTNLETYYRFRIRIIRVETAAIQNQLTFELKSDDQVSFLLGGRKLKSAPTSNVKNNWVSGEVSGGLTIYDMGASFGARYERMFSPYISLGPSFYYYVPFLSYYASSLPKGKEESGSSYGIDATVRFYPGGGKFLLGLGLGYRATNRTIPENTGDYDYIYFDNKGNSQIINKDVDYTVTCNSKGLAITGELGLKIPLGKDGGFFVQPGFLGTFIIGTESFSFSDEKYRNSPEDSYRYREEEMYLDGYWRIYFGAGWAF